MKSFLTLSCIMICLFCFGQTNNVEGVYKKNINGVHTLILIKDGYLSETLFKDNTYLSTRGGTYEVKGNTLALKIEYNDAKPDEIGKSVNLQLKDLKKQPKIKQDLDALWRITARMQNNEMSQIPKADRKTIKLLVDGYFQWIAINPKEKGFYGTGGGQYSFKNLQYTEKIMFFSRDNSRVGQSLTFKGELKNNQWHHSGLSSKGDPIHEIWSKEQP